MLNKSKRNKIKIRSTKKKQKRRTKKNYKYGGQKEIGRVESAFVGQFYSDAPNVDEEQIHSIGFEIPDGAAFNEKKDNYKFLEMADRDMMVDMERKLNKYELEISGGIGSQYCKYMYLIRAQNQKTGNTVLHYICNRRSVEMFQLVWPYYLVLYNIDFPDLLQYYINKKNNKGETPLDLLSTGMGPRLALDYNTRLIEGSFGTIKNVALKALNVQKLATTVLRRVGNSTMDRESFIKKILDKFGGKTGSELSGQSNSNRSDGPQGLQQGLPQ
jgi:hypothetical protein